MNNYETKRNTKKLIIMKHTSETFLSVPGYEGLYEVSDKGNVKSLRRGKLMKLIKSHGYLVVNLRKDNKLKKFLVHRLVAKAFIPNPNNLPFINHKDEIKTNNCVDNLEWCTQSYNNTYGTAIKRRVETRTGREYIEDPELRHKARNDYKRKYNQEHKEEHKKWYQEHKEDAITRARIFKQNNKEKVKEYNQRYYQKRKAREKEQLNPSIFQGYSSCFEDNAIAVVNF